MGLSKYSARRASVGLLPKNMQRTAQDGGALLVPFRLTSIRSLILTPTWAPRANSIAFCRNSDDPTEPDKVTWLRVTSAITMRRAARNSPLLSSLARTACSNSWFAARILPAPTGVFVSCAIASCPTQLRPPRNPLALKLMSTSPKIRPSRPKISFST